MSLRRKHHMRRTSAYTILCYPKLIYNYSTTLPNPNPLTPLLTHTPSPTLTVSIPTGSSIQYPLPSAHRLLVPLCPPAPTFALLVECPQRPAKGFLSSPSSTPSSLSVLLVNSPLGTPTGGVTQRPPRKRYSDVSVPSVSSETSLYSITSR